MQGTHSRARWDTSLSRFRGAWTIGSVLTDTGGTTGRAFHACDSPNSDCLPVEAHSGAATAAPYREMHAAVCVLLCVCPLLCARPLPQCYKFIFAYMGFAVFNIFFFITGALFIQVRERVGMYQLCSAFR